MTGPFDQSESSDNGEDRDNVCAEIQYPLTFEFSVRSDDHGGRIDSFLAKHFRNYTSWRLHRLAAESCVLIDGLPCDVNQRVFHRQVVTIRLLEPPDKLLEPEAVSFDVLYEDPWMLVVHKPAGMVAHPIGQFQSGTLCNALQDRLDNKTIVAGLLRPGIVHRLDRMTSGLLMVAKTAEMHAALSLLIQNGVVEKQYLALVQGHPDFETAAIDIPIGAAAGSSILMSVADDCRNPRKAKTDVRVIKRLRNSSLVQCRLHTGRNHQIRVHLASVGHPVLGDEFYRQDNKLTAKQEAGRDLSIRHALHASILQFKHPFLNHLITVRSPPPLDFWQTLGLAGSDQ